MRRERMPQRVPCRGLADARCAKRLSHGALKRLIADVMTARDAGAWIDRSTIGREYILPSPFICGCRIFAGQRKRHPRSAEAILQIHPMQALRLDEMCPQDREQSVRKHRDAVLGAFPIANKYLPPAKVNVLDA